MRVFLIVLLAGISVMLSLVAWTVHQNTTRRNAWLVQCEKLYRASDCQILYYMEHN